MRFVFAAVCASFPLALVACGLPSEPSGRKAPREVREEIDVRAAVGAGAVRGVSLAGDNLDLVVDGRGIVRVDSTGAPVAEHALGQDGLEDRGFHDVASLESGQFVLLSDAEGYLYDPATQAFSVHFCVEPGFTEPVVLQRNDALAVNDSLILAAPRFYTLDDSGNELLTSSALRTYRAADGTPLDAVDLTSEGLELTGVAQAGDEVLGVQGDELVRFALDGTLLARDTLQGVGSASGLAVDLAAGSILVADDSRGVIAIFDL